MFYFPSDLFIHLKGVIIYKISILNLMSLYIIIIILFILNLISNNISPYILLKLQPIKLHFCAFYFDVFSLSEHSSWLFAKNYTFVLSINAKILLRIGNQKYSLSLTPKYQNKVSHFSHKYNIKIVCF